MNRVLWIAIFLIQYIMMIASYGGEVVAAMVTTSFLFLLALNPYWANYISGVINLRDNLILYMIVVVLPLLYSLWKFFDVQEGVTFEVVVLWGDGTVSIPLDNLEVYCLTNIFFSVLFIAFYIFAHHKIVLNRKG